MASQIEVRLQITPPNQATQVGTPQNFTDLLEAGIEGIQNINFNK